MRSEITRSIWLPRSRPEARLRLLCFPYAGAGANVYRGWEKDLGEDVELAAVQLPGREWRRSEPPLTQMDALVEHLLPEVSAWLEDPRPGLFFGYSLGAALAFVLAQRLRQTHQVGPSALFVAACRAPQLLGKTRLHGLGDDDFLAAIRGLGGMPDFIAAEPALLQLTLPTLRADFELLETHAWQAQGHERLPCPVHAYVGSEDQMATRAEMAEWRSRTSGRFQIRLFSGGHFFITAARGQLLKTLAADLALVQTETRAAPPAPIAPLKEAV
jgi:medium-chain acyl-[acyl-carrier-protein] hydrolase